MARIIPSDISPFALAGAHYGELETLALLEAQLGPDYRVRNVNAAGLDQSRILDTAATDGLARRIERLLGPGEPDPARRTLVEDFFCQTFEVVPQIHARTFYGFCDQFLRARGEPLDYKGMNQPGFWNTMQDRVLSAPIPDAWRFDVLILDEGQDFEADWLEILKLFLTENGRILWLDDPDQNLLGKPPVDLPGFVRLHSRHNYRSPYGIARFMRSHLPFDFEPANTLPGLGVGVHPYRDADDQAKHLDAAVADLIALGFAPDEIVILSLRGIDQSPLWKHDRIGRHTIRRFTGSYQPDGVQLWTDGDITLDSLYRFKGQDAPAIILTDVEDQKDPERLDRLLYCGMGRATVRVDVLVKGESGIGKRLGVT
jgi:hypothetical protein